jgi:hypothetical protein
MRIVSKAELMAMPEGTPFATYHGRQAGWPDSFNIFVRPTGNFDDFYYRSTDNPEFEDSAQLFDRQEEMDAGGTSYPVDVSIDRDGLYDPTDRYVVWEPDDVRRIINLLQGGDDEKDSK